MVELREMNDDETWEYDALVDVLPREMDAGDLLEERYTQHIYVSKESAAGGYGIGGGGCGCN